MKRFWFAVPLLVVGYGAYALAQVGVYPSWSETMSETRANPNTPSDAGADGGLLAIDAGISLQSLDSWRLTAYALNNQVLDAGQPICAWRFDMKQQRWVEVPALNVRTTKVGTSEGFPGRRVDVSQGRLLYATCGTNYSNPDGGRNIRLQLEGQVYREGGR